MKTLSKSHLGRQILSIDWETSGSLFTSYEETFQKFQGISFGAVVASSETFEPIETLYREIKFDSNQYEWSLEAEKIHGLSREYLEKVGVTREEAAVDLGEMILKYFGTEKVAFLGHNIDFDIEATKQLLVPFKIMPKVHHVKLETAGAAFIMIGKYKSDDVFEFFTGQTRTGYHNALDDSLLTLETVRNMRTIFTEAITGEHK